MRFAASSGGMTCPACSHDIDPHAPHGTGCDEHVVAFAGAIDSSRALLQRVGDAPIAEAEARLLQLTRQIAAVEAERAAIAQAITLARRAQSEGAPNGGEPRAPMLDVHLLRLTFGGPHGTRAESSAGDAVAVPAARRRLFMSAELPREDLRAHEVRAVWEALANGVTLLHVAGAPGAGASTLLAVLAADARAHGFSDGALYVTDASGPAIDLAQRLHALFYVEPLPRYGTPAELDRHFAGIAALVLLDRANLTAREQTELRDLLPSLRFIIVDAHSVPGTSTIALGPLDSAHILTCLEAGYGRRLDADEQQAAFELCATTGALPGSSRLIGVAAGELRRSFTSLRAQYVDGRAVIVALIASLPLIEQGILGVLALADVPLSADSLCAIFGRSTMRAPLERLIDCELLRANGPTYELPRVVVPLVPAVADPDEAISRIIAALVEAFDPWSSAPVLNHQLIAAEPMVRSAFEQSRWERVLAFGPRLAEMLATRGAFAAWGRVLNLVAAAAKRTDDAAALNLARHELGVRSLALGEEQKAATYLRSAERERERLGDSPGAALSAAALRLVPDVVPIPEPAISQLMPIAPAIPPAPSAPPAANADADADAQRRRLARERFLANGPAFGRRLLALVGFTAVVILVLGLWFLAHPKSAVAIAEFTTDQAAIDSGATAQLCVKAVDAAFVEIAPEVGPLEADGEHCVMVRPLMTTTYTAVARGSEGQAVRGSVTVEVRGMAQPPLLGIQSFSANPARVNAGQTTHLCYAVTGAELLRIVPSVGHLVRLRSCQTLTLTEPHTYTYKLFAIGGNGRFVVRETKIQVVTTATPAPTALATAAPISAHVSSPAAVRSIAGIVSGGRKPPPGGWVARDAVYQFDVTPTVVARGQAASLCVGVGRYARGAVTTIGPLQPGITRCYRVHPAATTVYELHVALDRSTDVESVTVAVAAPVRLKQIARAGRR